MIDSWIKTIKKLSNVGRFSQVYMSKPENVLEHSAMVSMLCLQIGYYLSESERLELLTRAMVHDIEESEIGDVSRPAKYFNNNIRAAFRELEDYTANKIFEQAGIGGYLKYWANAKDGNIGSIIKFCDIMSVLIIMHDESHIRKNKSINEVISSEIFDHVRALSFDVEQRYVNLWGLMQEYRLEIDKMEKDICM